MDTKYLNEVSNSIKKTGFVLEYEITKKLNDLGWTTINNRYYVDDIQNTVREIDIVAYKAREVKKVRYYTILIISCKKSEECNWAFLTKELYKKDPNFNHYPVSFWTNDEYLEFMLSNENWHEEIIDQVKTTSPLKEIYGLEKQVFAFQEVSSKNSKVQNDKNIFNSVSSLVKALGYELKSLNHRVKVKSYYNFCLLSVADVKFIDVYFKDGSITAKPINSINFLNRFIVWNEDDFYRINFVAYNHFEQMLNHYSKLHDWNVKYYSNLKSRFFDELITDQKKLNFQFERCIEKLKNRLFYRFHLELNKDIDIEDFIGLSYEDNRGFMKIKTNFDSETIEKLNKNQTILNATNKWLNQEFNFYGDFQFDHDLPF